MRNRAPRVSIDNVEEFVKYLEQNASGRDLARTWRRISADLHLGRNGDRVIRALAHAANKAGHLVCSGNAGYWIASSLEEAGETAGRLRSQAQKMLRRADEVERLAAAKYGQAQFESATRRRRRDVSELQMTLV